MIPIIFRLSSAVSPLLNVFLPFNTHSMFLYMQSALKKSEGLDIVFEDDSSDSEDESAPVSKHILISFQSIIEGI